MPVFIAKDFNNCIDEGVFPDDLKHADVTIAHKKTQHCLLAMLEKFEESVDKGNESGALLTDLSKAFDCIDYKC